MGSVCRAMKSMGFSQLVLSEVNEVQNEEWIQRMAVHAHHIYKEARRTASLKEALADMNLSVAFTRRRGSKRKFYSLLPEQLVETLSHMPEGNIALVFGNEQDGLSEEEMEHCSLTCHIPTSPEFPSLNLSHAVQIILYELYRGNYDDTHKFKAVSRNEIQSLTDTVMSSLSSLDFFKPSDNFNMRQYWLDILSRAQLSKKECDQMEKIFRKIEHRYPGAKGQGPET